MAQLLKTQITGSLTDTGSLVVSGSQPVQLPLVVSGSDINPDLITNQFWYDTGDGEYKYSTIGSYKAGAWSQGGALITARDALAGAGASNQSSIVFGGSEPSVSNNTEEYNGTAWANGGDLNVARLNLTGIGTQDATLAAGGRTILW